MAKKDLKDPLRKKSILAGTAVGAVKGSAKGFLAGSAISNAVRIPLGSSPVLVTDLSVLGAGLGAVKGVGTGFHKTRERNKLTQKVSKDLNNSIFHHTKNNLGAHAF